MQWFEIRQKEIIDWGEDRDRNSERQFQFLNRILFRVIDVRGNPRAGLSDFLLFIGNIFVEGGGGRRRRRPDLIPFKFPVPRRLKELAFDLVARLLGIGRRKILAASLSRPVHVD